MRTAKSVVFVYLMALILPASAADAPARAPAPNLAPDAVQMRAAEMAKPAPPPPLAIVNGVALDPIQVDLVRMDLIQHKRPATDENVRNFMIDNELLVQESLRRGLDKEPEVKAVIALQQKDVLAKAFLDEFVKQHPVSDERAMAEYEKIKASTNVTEYRPSHILVDKESLAQAIITSLNKKRKTFQTLAKEYSKDSNGKEGGDLGWLTPDNLVPEFGKAMVALKKGEYTQTPVKTQFGWHVILLQDTRKLEFPPFDKVKDRVVKQLLQQDIRDYLRELRATAKIEIPGQK